jgi:hypothetical protein
MSVIGGSIECAGRNVKRSTAVVRAAAFAAVKFAREMGLDGYSKAIRTVPACSGSSSAASHVRDAGVFCPLRLFNNR